MKKIPAFICIFLLSLTIIKFNIVHASSASLTVPTSESMEYADLGFSIMQILASGGSINIEDVTSLEDLLEDPDIMIQSVSQNTDGTLSINYLAKGSMTNENRSRIKQWRDQNLLAGNENIDFSTECLVGWGPYEFSTFAAYSEFWLNKYVDYVVPEQPAPDAEYYDILNLINSRERFTFNDRVDPVYPSYSLIGCRVYYGAVSNQWTMYDPKVSLLGFDNVIVNITSANGQYIVTNNIQSLNDHLQFYWNQNFNYAYNNLTANNGVISAGVGTALSGNLNYLQGSFSTLDDALYFVSQFYNNITLYVNGRLWLAYQDMSPYNNSKVSFDDAVGVGNYEDLAYDVIMPDTTDNEAFIDLTSLLSRINDLIQDGTNDRVITYEDVSDLVIDDTGEETGDVVLPVVNVITKPGVIDDTSDFPNVPVPPIPVHNGLKGTSILAELIDACQNILPSEIVEVFWGMILIMFLIGLIRILHK